MQDPLQLWSRLTAAPGASKGVGGIPIHPTIGLPFDEVKPSHQTDPVASPTMAAFVGVGSFASTKSCISNEANLIATDTPTFASPVTVITDINGKSSQPESLSVCRL